MKRYSKKFSESINNYKLMDLLHKEYHLEPDDFILDKYPNEWGLTFLTLLMKDKDIAIKIAKRFDYNYVFDKKHKTITVIMG